MSETPHHSPEGGKEAPKTWLNLVPRMTKATHDKCAQIISHPVTIGAAVGTLAMPGYGTIIGAVMGPSMVKMMEPKKGGHDDHGGH